jgi:UDP-2-acetamido-3-amino-2,3-dideoxy-glucuronate N-acetyltransferase
MRIHPTADVQTSNIGDETLVWQFAVILPSAVIGRNCNINCHTFIENNVRIGNRVTVKSGVYLWDGIVVDDDVFIGPNVTFVNDKYPRSKKYPEKFQETKICRNVSIGANATILGSVVTKNVESYTLVYGNPAKVMGKINENGTIIKLND